MATKQELDLLKRKFAMRHKIAANKRLIGECSLCKEPAEEGKSRCTYHMEYYRKKGKERYWDKRKNNLCVMCGSEDTTDKGAVCDECRVRYFGANIVLR